ncbi:MAG: hypothetical protein mread185_000142 [Mycoplasmataceae bacterium]|nr:MAG: hypothetical protein mread185_000142 [Mycoplasmataceae bacterium]
MWKRRCFSSHLWIWSNKTSPIYHCDPCARNAHSYFRREARDRERASEATKKQKEQTEQTRKNQEYKLSHCQQCGKKSNLYHYIFDKRTKKLSSSTKNATDADNQIVFCSESHYKSWLKTKLSKIYQDSQSSISELERNQERMEELITERAELQRKLVRN